MIDAGMDSRPKQPACGLDAVPCRPLPSEKGAHSRNAVNRLRASSTPTVTTSTGPSEARARCSASFAAELRWPACQGDSESGREERHREGSSPSSGETTGITPCAVRAASDSKGGGQFGQDAPMAERFHRRRLGQEAVEFPTLLPGVEETAETDRQPIRASRNGQ